MVLLGQASGGFSWGSLLSFLQSAAILLGQGLVRLVNYFLPANRALGEDFVGPLGYLGLLTLVLVIFNLIAAARKVIWLVVVIGWALMVLRIVLFALGIQ
jgi:hypothetical protein